ncbi:MAG: AMP-binding protein [Spirochaetia bacterium]|jgi:long-chain acyl-CoA synthetase|uniref:Long-chain-fatty-acid--CoA ligase n=1 Tax=bioreactor metagenome TaxID=1076179 RepID=A0A644TZ65_9ZZZZ|nr:AMP-binding protein [Spirochaetia bacterium]MDD3819884.1 AMP-binding protein [Spirochaetales bacterium]NLX45703.1 long-chain fatty acid--CoA ligase [Treponema sp.]HAP54952.1 long-chain fatty acid--CoA ligase [Spirochaetaceae bacterium]MCE1208063.1 AMP-binding protein [Spirochaetia bacterium]
MVNQLPWTFLDEYRGKVFTGTWPTIPQMFRITVLRYPDRPCFTEYAPDRISLSYSQAYEKIQTLAAYLRGLGLKKEEKIALTGKNSPEWAVAYLAILEAGAVVVPIDYQISMAETKNLLKASDATILFVDEEKAAELTTFCAGFKKVISLHESGKDYIYDLRLSEGSLPPEAQSILESDLAAILFTSGTTGTPKGVMLSHSNLVSDCYLAQANLHIYHTDVFYALLPIHHSYTMLAVFIEAISIGAEIVFGKKMVVKQILKDLKEAQVTMFLGVPLLFNKLLNGILKGVREKGVLVYGLISFLMGVSGLIKKLFKVNPGKKIFHSILDKASLSSIRICISGGGPLAPSVFKKYNELGIDFIQGYGLTETSPILTLNPKEHYKVDSVGKIIPQVEMKILDPNEDGIGEIAVKGPMVMKGYYTMPEETAEVFTEDGWFKTGDLGYLDEENYVYLTGRAKNLIVTEGGKNVYPEEIENRFQLYMEIDQILVKGYHEKDDESAELIEALVYPEQEWLKKLAGTEAEAYKVAEARMEAIVEEVNQKLLPYQKILRVRVLHKPLEMTTTKKVKRFSL